MVVTALNTSYRLVPYSNCSLKISEELSQLSNFISLKVAALDTFQHKNLNKSISKKHLLHQVYPDQLVQELIFLSHMFHVGRPGRECFNLRDTHLQFPPVRNDLDSKHKISSYHECFCFISYQSGNGWNWHNRAMVGIFITRIREKQIFLKIWRPVSMREFHRAVKKQETLSEEKKYHK